MTTPNNLHVVFGTGAIGMTLIEQLHAGGKEVRAVNRRGTANVPEGVEVVGGDGTNSEFTKAAAKAQRSSTSSSTRPTRSGRSCSRRFRRL